MKKLFVIFLMMMFSSAVFAQIPARKINNPPVGTFKKKRNGTIVQYDKNGKKIGEYKIGNGKYLQIK